QARQAEAEAWLTEQRGVLGEDDWCALVQGFAHLLMANGAHAQAEEILRVALRHYPQRLALYALLAELAQQQGRTPQVVALLCRAIRLAEQQGSEVLPLWLRLSAAYLPHKPKSARQAAEQATALLGVMQEEAAHSAAQLGQWRDQAELALADVEAQ